MSEYQQLSELEHILKFPHLSLGNSMIEMETIQTLDVGRMKVMDEQVPYCRAIERLYLEILHNAGDNAEVSRMEGIDPGSIDVTVTQDTIRIRNEGRPISTGVQVGTNMHIPEFIFSCLRVSGNYRADSKRKIASTHGLGAKLSNIFSIMFHLDIGNGDEGVRYRQMWRNNTNVRGDPRIEPYDGPSYTQITFTPDFARFYDDDVQYGFSTKRAFTSHMLKAFAKHAADMSFTAKVPVSFNGVRMECTTLESYGRLYHDGATTMAFKTEDSECLIVDTPNQGRCISFVNGTINTEGGVHVKAWKKEIYNPIHIEMKKYKVKDRDIDDHITMILACRLLKPKFKSQTKDYVTHPRPTVAVDPSRITSILRWSGIIQLEQILKGRLNAIARKSDGSKKSLVNVTKLVDAHAAGGPQSHLCTLYITEGDSAANFAIKGIQDGTYNGAMPIKGKLLNVGTCTIEQYANNEEITELKRALGLREDMDYSDDISTLRYGKLIILSDQDVDGMHIRGLILNFFRLKFPSLLKRGFVQVMDTPLMRVGSNAFYHQNEYNEWVKEDPSRSSLDVSYYKGLGTSSDAELLDAFKRARYITYEWDDRAESLMSVAFDPGHEDGRKALLLSWCKDRNVGIHASKFKEGTISHFVTNQLAEFSSVNTGRTIPSVVDGLKECQRKVMCVLLSMKKPKKVSQLKGEVSDKMQYKYGDDALGATIVGLGNYAVGTNNVPLIKAKGQYDSRMGPGTAADDRYIYASPSPILSKIFRPEDECILQYQYDGNDRIEPKTYFPIVPLFAINGAMGIGSGFSTNIPNYHPVQVIKYIIWWLSKKGDRPTLVPWYRNYQGRIENINGSHYSIGSFETIPSRKQFKDIMVTEIPVTQSINSYIRHLQKLQEKPIVKGNKATWIKAFKSIPKNMKYKYNGDQYIEILPCIVIEGAYCINTHEGGALRALGLIEKICETNNTLLDETHTPHKYGSIYDAIDAYCESRYQAYKDRRSKMMEKWKAGIERLHLRKEFIQAILDGRIVIKGKSQAQLMEETGGRYPPEFMRMSIGTMTNDGIERIDREIENLQAKYDAYHNTSAANIWISELKELYSALNGLVQ